MKKTNCPYCNAGLTVPEEYLGTDVTCPSCGQSFFCDADAPDADPGDNAPFVRSRPQPSARRSSRPPQSAFVSRGPAGNKPPQPPRFVSPPVTVEESRQKVVGWAIGLEAAGLICAVLGGISGFGLFFWLAGIFAGAFPVGAMMWGLIYLRTIALNSERR